MHPNRECRTTFDLANCRVFVLAAAVPLLFAACAWPQLPAPPPRLPAPSTQGTAPVAPVSPNQKPPNQTLPAAQPTQLPVSHGLQPAAKPAQHAYRARVEFADNLLTIAAENSSLDEILRDIANLTGMKITGGVNDERVYGNYGPDSAQAVLNELLDGTGTNVLLLETPQHTLAELVLSPRNGGPTPPSPNASRDEERNEESLPPGLSGRRRDLPPGGRRGRITEGEPVQENRATEQPGAQPQTGTPANGEPTVQPDASQQSPNGVKTPQQISEDLVKQQQQQAPTTPPQ